MSEHVPVARVPKWGRITSSTIREKLNIKTRLLFIEESQLMWLGHVKIMPEDRIQRKILSAVPGERRPVGRLGHSWE